MLFENITPQMTHAISKQIDLLLKNFEPRCRLVQINVQPSIERNGYRASISFFVINTPERVEIESFLERLR
jgi:phage baseplate assembly protein W